MKHISVLLLLMCAACGGSGSNGSASSSSRGKNSDDKGKPAAAQVKIPDPHASKDSKVGRQAGVGNDPNDLDMADPNTGRSGSGGRQGHATR